MKVAIIGSKPINKTVIAMIDSMVIDVKPTNTELNNYKTYTIEPYMYENHFEYKSPPKSKHHNQKKTKYRNIKQQKLSRKINRKCN